MSDQDKMDLTSNQFVDDLIILGELTQYENTVWKFPETTRCPLRSCGKYLGTRKKAIKHYQDNHAKYGVLCKICNYPIHLQTGTHHFDGHYARKHPNEVAPAKVKEARLHCSLCQTSLKTYVYLQAHMRNVHNKKVKKSQNKKKSVNSKIQRNNTTGTAIRRRNTGSNVVESSVTHSNIYASADDSNECNEASETVDGSAKLSAKAKQLRDQKAQRSIHPNAERPCNICRLRLKNYVVACNHYRQMHGLTVSMCPFCKTYFTRSTALIQHMMAYHELAKPPKVSLIQSKKSTAKNARKNNKPNQIKNEEAVVDADPITSNDGRCENRKSKTENHGTNSTSTTNDLNEEIIESAKVDDDIVTLGEMTEYPILQWKFPQIAHCPRMNCKRKFPNRDAAIDHYRAMHAKYDILCQECDLIISVSGAHNLMNHYKRKHPDIEPPAKRPENRTTCQVCGKVLSFPQLRIHMEQKHKNNQIDSAKMGTVTIKRSSRILMRKVSVQTQSATELNASNSPMKILLRRFASVPNVNGENSSTQSPMSVELTNKDDEHNGSSNSCERQLNVDQKNDETSLTKTSACDTSPKTPAKQNTRSSGVRHKACTLCGMTLKNYAIAWDHYQRIHGRNVLICPFCDQYFLQSNLLTKHVMTMHHKFNGNTGPVDTQVRSKISNDNAREATVPVVIQRKESVFISTDTSTSMESSNQPDQAALSNDKPLDLTLKREVVAPYSGIIDLTSGALDLRMRK